MFLGCGTCRGCDDDDRRYLQSSNDTTTGQASVPATTLNTWTNYTSDESSLHDEQAPEPPADYLAVINDMNFILSNLAASFNATDSSKPCFLGAKLSAQ